MNARKPGWIARQFQGYNIGEMAVVFGVSSVLVALLLALLWASFYSAHATVSDTVAVACVTAWGIFSLWLWVSLVVAGKQERRSRTSDRDLRAMNILFFFTACFTLLFSSGTSKAEWWTISLTFEWISLALQALYFLLAMCIWVRVPRATCLRFAAGLLIVTLQSMR